jgi:hypothetical protein
MKVSKWHLALFGRVHADSNIRFNPFPTRDAQASKPDEEVWLLRCEGASYRVRLIPDMAARVERIDK